MSWCVNIESGFSPLIEETAMLAVIRARFPNAPASAVWSDAAMNAWLNPNIAFSLAHYWRRASFFQADMNYFLFPPVVLGDPRGDGTLGADARERLVRGVLNEVSRASDPDWDLFDQFLICFAQAVDMFGGGAYALKTRPGSDRTWITGALIDIASPFDGICQELGHAFGFDHELDLFGNEYGCPYSPMSASGQGSSFTRPVDPQLPVGVALPPDTGDPQRIVGPYIPVVHFYAKNFGAFVHPDSVYQVPASYVQSPHSFRIEALDKGVSAWPQRKRILAVLPPAVTNGDAFFLELRRRRDYDQGIALDTSGATGTVPAGIVIYSYSTTTGRVTYRDRIAFKGTGDRDYHSYGGFFAVRLMSVDDDFGGATVMVGGGDFWKHFSVDFDQPQVLIENERPTQWTTVQVAPCFLYEKAPHQYRAFFGTTHIVLEASSYGYEKPGYRWFVNDQALDPNQSSLTLNLPARMAVDGEFQKPEVRSIVFQYRVLGNRLDISTSAPFSGIYVTVKVISTEFSQEVLQNFYPDQSVWTGVSFNNVRIEWDAGYVADQVKCWKKFRDIERKYSKSAPFKIPKPEPDPRFDDLRINVLLKQLVDKNPAVANAVIDEVANLAQITRLDVLKRL
jgi:hypothetical protein